MNTATIEQDQMAPYQQRAFSTVSLSLIDWVCCVAVASSVLWLRELSKIISRMSRRNRIMILL